MVLSASRFPMQNFIIRQPKHSRLRGSLHTGRDGETATLLNNGEVLIVGGYNYSTRTYLTGAELYNPLTGTFSVTGSLHTARMNHTATLLQNGMVLVVGGHSTTGNITSAELYNPSTGTFGVTGSLNTGRQLATATLLQNGMVLIAAERSTEWQRRCERRVIQPFEYNVYNNGKFAHGAGKSYGNPIGKWLSLDLRRSRQCDCPRQRGIV